MTILSKIVLQKIIETVKHGGIIAYPTEAVYGLGCDPHNQSAVEKILKLKQRSLNKGFILIGSEWQQIQDYINVKNIPQIEKIKSTWPGPITWVFPKSDKVPPWIHGNHNTIAVRITAHPIARQICSALDSALVSTSLNISEQMPVRDYKQACESFKNEIDFIVEGKTGDLKKPTPIRSAITGEFIRC